MQRCKREYSDIIDNGFISNLDFMGDTMEHDLENNNIDGIINLPDIIVGRSLGAQALNYDIETPDGEVLHITEGTRITNIQVIAGKGRDRQIDVIDMLIVKYGGESNEWQKVKGLGYVDFESESYKAEIHWYQEPTIGKVEFKLKPQRGGKYFID